MANKEKDLAEHYSNEYAKFTIGYPDNCPIASQPIDLSDLAKSFDALAKHYNDFAKATGLKEGAKLQVRSVSEGSIEMILVDQQAQIIIGGAASAIAGTLFSVFFKIVVHIIKKAKEGKNLKYEDRNEEVSDYKNILKIIELLIVYKRLELAIEMFHSSGVETVKVESGEAGTVNKNLTERITEMETTKVEEFFQERFSWSNPHRDMEGWANKGIIASIAKILPVYIPDEAEKERMRTEALLNIVYLVDGEVVYKSNERKRYNILKVHRNPDGTPKVDTDQQSIF